MAQQSHKMNQVVRKIPSIHHKWVMGLYILRKLQPDVTHITMIGFVDVYSDYDYECISARAIPEFCFW